MIHNSARSNADGHLTTLDAKTIRLDCQSQKWRGVDLIWVTLGYSLKFEDDSRQLAMLKEIFLMWNILIVSALVVLLAAQVARWGLHKWIDSTYKK